MLYGINIVQYQRPNHRIETKTGMEQLMDIMESYKYAAQLKPAGMEYPLLVANVMPSEKRDSIYAVLGSFQGLIDDILSMGESGDPDRLISSWRRLIDDAYDGRENEHPIYSGLHDSVSKYGLKKDIWVDFTSAVKLHLENKRFPDMAAFRKYCHLSYGSAFYAFIQIISAQQNNEGYHSKIKPEFISEELALMAFIIQTFKDLGADIRRSGADAVHIPESRLNNFELGIDDLLEFANGKEIDDRFRKLVNSFYHLGRDYELFTREKLVLIRGEMSKEEWFALDLLLNIYSRFLHRIWEFPQSIFNGGFPIDPAMVFINALKLQRDLGLEFKQDLSRLLSQSA